LGVGNPLRGPAVVPRRSAPDPLACTATSSLPQRSSSCLRWLRSRRSWRGPCALQFRESLAQLLARARGTGYVSQRRCLRQQPRLAGSLDFGLRRRSGNVVLASSSLCACKLTSRSSGRVQQRRSASRVANRGAPLNSRSVSLHSSVLASSTFFSLFAFAAASSMFARSSRFAVARVPGAAVGARTRDGLRLSAPVASAAPLAGRRPRLRAAAPLGRRGVSLFGIVGMQANQSFERTRSAAASGFAGQQLWRAAQLQIR
jgi:hypothetical protein